MHPAERESVAGAWRSPQPRNAGILYNEKWCDGTLLVISAALVLAVVFATGILVTALRSAGFEERRRELGNLALTLSEQIDRSFQSLELVERSIIERITDAGITDRAQLAAVMSRQPIHELMREKMSGMPHVDALTLIDDTGRLINFSRSWPIPRVNVADRDYFKVLKGMGGEAIFISEPVVNRATATVTLYLAQRFVTPDNRFLGLVLGAMEQSYFESFFSGIALGSGGLIALVRDDGALLASYPGSAAGASRDAAVRARRANALLASQAPGLPIAAGVLDEKVRIAAVQPLARFPLAVVVSDGVDAVERRIWQATLPIVVAAGLICCVILLVAYFVARQIRHERAFSDLERYRARHDPLTGLPNRLAFTEAVEAALREPERRFALLFLDLDYFKAVNDTLGHDVGDALLCAVARRIQASLQPLDLVARLGGDEFAVIRRGVDNDATASDLARKVIEVIREPFLLDRHQVIAGCSIGIALSPRDGETVAALLKNADLALYQAKSDGRNVSRRFLKEMENAARARRELELDLHEAWQRRQFSLAYQPIFEAHSGRLAGFEALLRWNHPTRGAVPPDLFVGVAEETGLILPIGSWVLEEACRAATQWPADLFVSVNLSPIQFRGAHAFHQVRSALERSRLPPGRLELEITESMLLQEGPAVRTTLDQFHAAGITLALDDFGTGYSSLSYLRTLNIGRIKVDRSFVEHVTDDPHSLAIVRAMLGLARALGLMSTAEGIETVEQMQLMADEGCTHLQGYLLGRPGPAEEALRLARIPAG